MHGPRTDLGPDRRYTNALLIDDDAPARWLAGTEAGLYCTENGGAKWTGTSLVGEPVRALLRAGGSYWAGADSGGVWRSADGLSWAPAGEGLGDTPVYALAWTGDRLLAGTERGVAQGDGRGPWQLSELPLRVAAVATGRDRWLAGACPGGLWCSRDMGATWTRDGDFQHVRAIEPPEEE